MYITIATYLYIDPDPPVIPLLQGCSDDSSSLCVYVSDEEVTWFDARADCLERGGELTSILVGF